MTKSKELFENKRLTFDIFSTIYRFYNRIVCQPRIIIWDFLYSVLSRWNARIRDECS